MLNDLALGHDGRDINPQLASFLRDAQERGTVRADELEALQHELDLDDEMLDAVRVALADAEVDIDEPSEELELDLEPAPAALMTADSLQLFLNEVGRHSLLTAAEEVMLAKRVERGDRVAKERMVNANLRLVVSIAKRYQGHGLPLLDLVQDGVIGLNRAVEKFDWRKGYKFSTYATWWIRQSCQRAVANQSDTIRIPVHVQERRQKLRRARQRLEATHGRMPTVEELAAATQLKRHHVEEALEAAEASVSLNQTRRRGRRRRARRSLRRPHGRRHGRSRRPLVHPGAHPRDAGAASGARALGAGAPVRLHGRRRRHEPRADRPAARPHARARPAARVRGAADARARPSGHPAADRAGARRSGLNRPRASPSRTFSKLFTNATSISPTKGRSRASRWTNTPSKRGTERMTGMAAAELEVKADTELDRIERWRAEELERAGYDHEQAALIAARHDVDLHSAVDIIRQGCSPELALSILL